MEPGNEIYKENKSNKIEEDHSIQMINEYRYIQEFDKPTIDSNLIEKLDFH